LFLLNISAVDIYDEPEIRFTVVNGFGCRIFYFGFGDLAVIRQYRRFKTPPCFY